MGTHPKVLSESYPMNTNMAGFRWFSKVLVYLWFEKKVVLALEGLSPAIAIFILVFIDDIA